MVIFCKLIIQYVIMVKIEYFKIFNLFNQYNVSLNFEDDVNIFLGENGMGKTTILSCLYYVLSGRLDKLDNILFDSVVIKFAGNEEFTLKRNDLNRYLEENVYDTPRYRRMRHSNLGNIFSEKEKEELKRLAFIVLTEGTKVMNYDDIYNFSLSD